MKIAVSYINSLFNSYNTIKKINETSADYIHFDLMDGKYVINKNFNKFKLKKMLRIAKKNLEIHLMVDNPEKYLKYFRNNDFVKNIYFHPGASKNASKLIGSIKLLNISPGIVINPDENIMDYKDYYKDIDRVLVMSVIPGKGGQKFLPNTIELINQLNNYKKNNKEIFDIEVDGGINNSNLSLLKDLNIDTVVCGSFICLSNDYEDKIQQLKKITN